jgi:hypothetical protein
MDQKDGQLDGRKLTKIIKTAKRGKSHQKNILKSFGTLSHNFSTLSTLSLLLAHFPILSQLLAHFLNF